MAEFVLVVPYKFAMVFTLGSLSLLASLAFLSGPYSFCKKLLRRKRVFFTLSYVGALLLTFVFSTLRKSLILMALCCVWQVLAMLFFAVSTVPGGATGLKFICWMLVKSVEKCVKYVLRL
uniref:Vesicle transport protein n=1 Tax=Euplotes harpa TaxID=151035 RepID=A0A7S3J2X8_9SPIT|mmetsp:Transcript_16972/g.19581  ORF Transcript_16972/g.19581 Transcript_16972/m.19581 type:complete len:120 (+) Transcript_16972:301-660(+)